jgi:hypothetical protein
MCLRVSNLLARHKMPWTKAEVEILGMFVSIKGRGGGKHGKVHGTSYCEREASENGVRICFISGRRAETLFWGRIVPIWRGWTGLWHSFEM